MMNTMTICQECQGRAATVSPILTPEYHTTPTTMKKSCRRIRFAPTVAVQPIDCTLTPEEHSRAHYSKDEMAAFSLEVKAIHTPSKQLPDLSSCGVHESEQDCMVGLQADPDLRGIEHYVCPVRVRNRIIAQKVLLNYQRHFKFKADHSKTKEEKVQSLASVSAKLSNWSKLVALETARLDSIRAFDVDYLIPISEPVVISQFPAVATKRARRVTCEDDEVDSQPQSKRRRS